jgi:hypothetical protein
LSLDHDELTEGRKHSPPIQVSMDPAKDSKAKELERGHSPLPAPAVAPVVQQSTATKQRIEKARKDSAQFETTLTTADAPKSMQDSIKTAPPKDITNRLQEIIDNADLGGKPQLEDVIKLSRGILRMRATTKEGATTIKEGNIDWTEAYPGVKVYKPKYGIVIHGVPTKGMNLDPGYTENADYKDLLNELQSENANRNNIIIDSIKPLRRRGTERTHKNHQSIIVFTEDAQAADRCIHNRFLIRRESFKVEKYAPHLQITQCYKCYGYRHTANPCTRKEQCGKCAHNHRSTDCTHDELKCVNCGGNHEAWHHECPTRLTEGKRLREEREMSSPFYTE